MDKILLIDGHNQIWRACVKFGFKPRTPAPPSYDEWAEVKQDKPKPTVEEQPDEIIFTFNFFRNLRPIIEQFSPDKCFFVLEGHPQFRYDLFADYKANRITKIASKKETSDTFFKTKDIILSLIKHLPITICRAANYEADDVISTLCEDMKEESITVISNDSDYIQLLQKGYKSCKVYNPIKKEYMEAPTYPYVAWKCLNGDKSDNIPALLKPKKAVDTVTNPDLFKKFLEVEENRANFSINRQLIEFRNVPVEEIETNDGVMNFDLLKTKFQEFKFESITNDQSWQKYCSTFNCIRY